MIFDFSSFPCSSAPQWTQPFWETSVSFPQGMLGSTPAAELWLKPGHSPVVLFFHLAWTVSKLPKRPKAQGPMTTKAPDHVFVESLSKCAWSKQDRPWRCCLLTSLFSISWGIATFTRFPHGTVILVNAVHLMILCKFKLVWADILTKGKDKRKWSKSCGP